MTNLLAHPKIYHITHAANLPRIMDAGVLWSDAKRIELGLDCKIVGMSTIKQRRLDLLEVVCHPGTKVGEYVPFYFCPRSIMLYILHKGNHPELCYQEGQRPILHLQADLNQVVHWADQNEARWAFSDRNAGANIAQFFKNLDDLSKVNWGAVEERNFRDIEIKEGKQAEFLIHRSFPWQLIEKIGVLNEAVANEAISALSGAAHSPPVVVERSWYY